MWACTSIRSLCGAADKYAPDSCVSVNSVVVMGSPVLIPTKLPRDSDLNMPMIPRLSCPWFGPARFDPLGIRHREGVIGGLGRHLCDAPRVEKQCTEHGFAVVENDLSIQTARRRLTPVLVSRRRHMDGDLLWHAGFFNLRRGGSGWKPIRVAFRS